MNNAPVERPWFTICSTPPVTPMVLKAYRPSMTNPMWLTDE